jgi:hypothetical protein
LSSFDMASNNEPGLLSRNTLTWVIGTRYTYTTIGLRQYLTLTKELPTHGLAL